MMIHNTMEEKTMNYVKTLAVAVLLFAVPSASAITLCPKFLKNAASSVKTRFAAFKKNPNKLYIAGGVGLAAGVGAVAAYKYNKTVRDIVDKAYAKTKDEVKSIANNPKKRALALGIGGTAAAVLAAWKLGWLKKVPSFGFGSSSTSKDDYYHGVKVPKAKKHRKH